METIKQSIEEYEARFEQTEITAPLILIVKILAQINVHLDNIASKMYE